MSLAGSDAGAAHLSAGVPAREVQVEPRITGAITMTLPAEWKDAICYFKEGKEVRVGRAYGRVCR